MRIFCAVSTAVLATLCTANLAAANLPLQVGVYQAGNRSARVAVRDNRLCVQFFALGTIVTASIDRSPDSLGVYNVERVDQVLVQSDLRSLLVGPAHELVLYTRLENVPTTTNLLIDECLSSRREYLNQTNAVGSLEGDQTLNQAIGVTRF